MYANGAKIIGGAFDHNRLCIGETHFSRDRLLSAIHIRHDRHGHPDLQTLRFVCSHTGLRKRLCLARARDGVFRGHSAWSAMADCLYIPFPTHQMREFRKE